MAGRDLFANISAPVAPKGRDLFAENKNAPRRRADDNISSGVSDPTPELDFPGASVIEPAATLISGAIAEPIAGIAGIIQSLNPFSEEGSGAKAVESVKESLTFKPKTEPGKKGLQAVSDVMEPVASALSEAESFLGDEAFESTGSPALAAAAKSIPTALLEIIGLASAKGVIKGANKTKVASQERRVQKAIVESAPDIDQLKDVSRKVYKELDDSGVTLRKKPFAGMVNKIESAVRKSGFDEDITPKTAKVLKRLKNEVGATPNLTEIDNLRKLAQSAASALEPADARLGNIVIDNIDSFLDEVSPLAFQGAGVKVAEIGPKFKVARGLWGRARRSELISESFEKAKNQASGFENGIVVQFRSILNNKKKSRFFKPKEINAMQDVVRGTTATNIAKLIGRLGFSEGHATNVLGGLVGASVGGAVFGAPGAIAVPVLGQLSRKLAQKLTRNNAELADIIVRAGPDAKKIAASYLSRFPKNQRSSAELSELLARPEIDLEPLLNTGNRLTREAAEIAKGNRILKVVAGSAAISLPALIETDSAQPEQKGTQ